MSIYRISYCIASLYIIYVLLILYAHIYFFLLWSSDSKYAPIFKCFCIFSVWMYVCTISKSSNSLNATWKIQFMVLRAVRIQWPHQSSEGLHVATQPKLNIARIVRYMCTLITNVAILSENMKQLTNYGRLQIKSVFYMSLY